MAPFRDDASDFSSGKTFKGMTRRLPSWPMLRKAASAAGAAVALLQPSLCAAADELTMLAHPPSVASPHPPLIVLMHGAGADEKDMIGLWRQLPPQFVVVSPRAPFGGGGNGWRWYRKGPTQDADLATSRKIVDLVVDGAIKRFDADPARVFIGGFSQGGVMTYEVAMHEPGRFRGAVVMSGTLFRSALTGDPPGQQTTPFFIGQGTADKVIPYSTAVAARDTLEKRGIAVTFQPYEGMAHTTSDAEIAAVSAWLGKRLDAVAR